MRSDRPKAKPAKSEGITPKVMTLAPRPLPKADEARIRRVMRWEDESAKADFLIGKLPLQR